MEVIVKKRYYKEDLYSVPGQGKGFTKKRLMDFADHIQKLSKIEYKKGDFKDYEVKTEKFCCEGLKEYGEAQAEKDFLSRLDRWNFGMFLPFQGWEEATYVRIDYCPFCGEKIEMVEKE